MPSSSFVRPGDDLRPLRGRGQARGRRRSPVSRTVDVDLATEARHGQRRRTSIATPSWRRSMKPDSTSPDPPAPCRIDVRRSRRHRDDLRRLRVAHRDASSTGSTASRRRSTTPPRRPASARSVDRDGRRPDRRDRGDGLRRAGATTRRRARRPRPRLLRRRLVVAVVLGAAGAAAVDGPGAAVRRLAVGRARAGDAGRDVGGVAVPPGDGAQPPPPPSDDGHADLGRRDRRLRWSLWALLFTRAGDIGMQMRWIMPAARRRAPTSTSRWRRRSWPSSSPGATSRRAPSAVPAMRSGRLLDLGAKDVAVLGDDGAERGSPVDRARRSATASSCVRARRSPPTVWSSRAHRRSTARW